MKSDDAKQEYAARLDEMGAEQRPRAKGLVHVADIIHPARQKAVRLPEPVGKALTPVKKRLVEASAGIRESMRKEDVSYLASHLASQLVQVTLPHSDPGDVPHWSRTNGNLTLSIIRSKVDSETGNLVGYPYGTIPRLLLYWITSEATRTKSRALALGRSLAEFMEEVGLNSSSRSGVRSDARRLRDQMNRLFGSAISFVYSEKIGLKRHESFHNMHIARSADLWWEPRNPSQGNLWESNIELSEDFYNAVTSAPVPLDIRALKALHHSSLALDLYSWATYKSFLLQRKGQSQFVSYQSLLDQLGAEYSDKKNFKKKLLTALKQVQVVYPSFGYKQARGGLIIYPGHPAIATNQVLGG
jgi:hypothetical protein